MNKYLRWLFAGFYGLSKRAYAEYNIAKIKNGDNIILGENCCIGDSAVIPTNKGGENLYWRSNLVFGECDHVST